jgi:hypothetical protein
MANRRFTRLTDAFSKKWLNHEHAISLHYFAYNFCCVNRAHGTTPAVAAGIANAPMKIADLVAMIESDEKQNRGHARINREDRS